MLLVLHVLQFAKSITQAEATSSSEVQACRPKLHFSERKVKYVVSWSVSDSLSIQLFSQNSVSQSVSQSVNQSACMKTSLLSILLLCVYTDLLLCIAQTYTILLYTVKKFVFTCKKKP